MAIFHSDIIIIVRVFLCDLSFTAELNMLRDLVQKMDG